MSEERLQYVHQKLKELSELPSGWYYGDGEPVSSHAIASAKYLVATRPQYAEHYRFFPDFDGAIMMAFEMGNMDYEVYFEPSGSIRVEAYDEEHPDQDIPDARFDRMDELFLKFFEGIVSHEPTDDRRSAF